MKIVKSSFLFCLAIVMGSCTSYIDKIHDQMDAEEKKKRKLAYNKFDQFRVKKDSVGKDLKSKFKTLSSKDKKSLLPPIKRKYVDQQLIKKRHKAEDLLDNAKSNGLWTDRGPNSFLFTRDQNKKYGDIILINVLAKLKNEITDELTRAYPSKAKQNKEKPKPAEDEEDKNEGKVFDKVSSVVVEEMGKDHLLLRGRKTLLFRNRKRLIELQALVRRTNVSDDDEVNSDKIIERNIQVIR